MRRVLHHLKKKSVIAILIIVALIASLVIYKKITAPPNFEVAEAKMGNVVESVSVTGNIYPIAKAELGFEKSGVLAKVYVKVGDAVKRGDVIASLSNASERAALSAAEATLADASRALTSEELALEKATLSSAESAASKAEEDALSTVHDAFVKAQGGLFNYTDTFYQNAQTLDPKITIRTEGDIEERRMNIGRLEVSQELSLWSTEISKASTKDVLDLILKSKAHLAKIKLFMNDLSRIVGALSMGNSGLTQSQIDSRAATMNSGLSSLASALETLSSSDTALSKAQGAFAEARSSYELKLAGNSAESIAAERARVEQARAAVSQGVIISPIDGVITKAEPEAGEFVSSGQVGFAVQNNNFKIESYVPEADIAKIKIGNVASSTLDAYGADVNFPAKVVSIDPAETVLEGVPTYKVTLEFTEPDSRIRSGMTANLTILTHEAIGVVYIPYRAVQSQGGEKFVRKVDPRGKTYQSVKVETGLKGSDGNIQILSGLSPGDKVVTYVKQ